MKEVINRTIFSFQKRDLSKKLLRMLEKGSEIIIPLCPDYIPGSIGNGVSTLMLAALHAASEVYSLYPQSRIMFVIADTEADISRSFMRKSIEQSQVKLAALAKEQKLPCKVSLFSKEFRDWHQRQYAFEDLIRSNLSREIELQNFFKMYSIKRSDRYAVQYGRNFDDIDTLALQIRHYAQYLTMTDILLENSDRILMNYQTENLRAVTKNHAFYPKNRRIELIVY